MEPTAHEWRSDLALAKSSELWHFAAERNDFLQFMFIS